MPTREEINALRSARRSQFLKTQSELKKTVHEKIVKEDVQQIKATGTVPDNEYQAKAMERRIETYDLVENLDQAAQAGDALKEKYVSGKNRVVRKYQDIEKEWAFGRGEGKAKPKLEVDGGIAEQIEENTTYNFSPKNTKGIIGLEEEEIQNQIHEKGDSKATGHAGSSVEFAPQQSEQKILSAHQKLLEQRKKLPIYKYRGELLECIAKNQATILVGETGSGKTTQIMQYLYEAGYCKEIVEENDNAENVSPTGMKKKLKLVCTQPRRIAATSVAERVAVEMGTRCGSLVGYKVRFDDKTSHHTLLEYVTDGMLLKDIMAQPELSEYSVVMVDEAHERSLPTDILLGFLKDLLLRRKDLKLIVASASMNADKFSEFFNKAPIFKVEGKMYPVSISYAVDSVSDFVEGSAVTAVELHKTKPLPGDILIFLPGQDDIERCEEKIVTAIEAIGSGIRDVSVFPVYSTLAPEKQKLIYSPTAPRTRKIVIATNIAETSITIDGIVYVIDCGLVKQNYYNPKSSMEALVLVPISKAQALQRKGRAGRTKPGECIRLYTKHTFLNELEDETVPEMVRGNLATIVLTLKALGIHNPMKFPFVDPPSPEAICSSLESLHVLGAIKSNGNLSKLGRKMAEFPLDPMMSKTLLVSKDYGCSKQVVIACSILTLQNNLFVSVPRDKRQQLEAFKEQLFGLSSEGGVKGDIAAYVKLFQSWQYEGQFSVDWAKAHYCNIRSLQRAREVRDQLVNILDRLDIPLEEIRDETKMEENVFKCFTAGYFSHVAKLNVSRTSYQVISTGSTAEIHPSSALFQKKEKPDFVLYIELRQTTKPFMMHVIEVEKEWLRYEKPVNAILSSGEDQTVVPAGYFTEAQLAINPKKRML